MGCEGARLFPFDVLPFVDCHFFLDATLEGMCGMLQDESVFGSLEWVAEFLTETIRFTECKGLSAAGC